MVFMKSVRVVDVYIHSVCRCYCRAGPVRTVLITGSLRMKR